jgi:hypothetical protein
MQVNGAFHGIEKTRAINYNIEHQGHSIKILTGPVYTLHRVN